MGNRNEEIEEKGGLGTGLRPYLLKSPAVVKIHSGSVYVNLGSQKESGGSG